MIDVLRYEMGNMAREGITFEQVAAAADALRAEGHAVTVRAVRERIGSGSLNTLSRHLASWRIAHPAAPASAAGLPPSVMAAIAAEIDRAAAKARAEIEDELTQARAEAAELAALGEQLEADREAIALELNATRQRCEQQAGQIVEQRNAITRQENRIAALEQAAGHAAASAAEIKRLRAALETSEAGRIEAREHAARLSGELAAQQASRPEAR